MDKHLNILGVLYVAFGIFGLLGASIVFIAVVGGGLLSGDPGAMLITSGIGSAVAVFLAGLSVPGLIAGIGLLQRRPWSRVLGLIMGFLNLIHIPFGTLLGAYAIWVLLQEESVQLLGATPRQPVSMA